MFTKATAYIDKLIEEKKLPLLDVFVYKNHELLYRRCGSYSGNFGKDELLCMFSCTKVVTAVCGMRLIEEGKIDLDAPVSNYIPAFADAYTLDENGEKRPEVIKVRHLFTMSTGFDYKIACPEILKIAKEKYDTATTLDVICELLKKPLNFTPGKNFLYSLSHDALGALIEALEGVSFAEYAQKNVFEPLGMKNTTFDITTDNYDSIAIQYAYDNLSRSAVEVPKDSNRYRFGSEYQSGGAGLLTTVDDYILLADALANFGVGKNGNRFRRKILTFSPSFLGVKRCPKTVIWQGVYKKSQRHPF